MLNCSNFLIWETSNLAVISSSFMVPELAELDSASRFKRVAMARWLVRCRRRAFRREVGALSAPIQQTLI